MNKKKLIELCLFCDDAIETYPFKDKTNEDYAVIRHKSNGKWFALIFYLDNKLYINLKCKPLDGAILRDTYPFITHAWHMNKAHWIKVEVKKAPIDLLKNIIKCSFELTQNKKKKQKLKEFEF